MKKYIYLKKDYPKFNLKENDTGFIVSHKNNFIIAYMLIIQQEVSIQLSDAIEFDIAATGDTHIFKVCDRCYKHLETKKSYQNNRLKKGDAMTKRPSCVDCRKIKDGVDISAKDRKIWDAKKPVKYDLFNCPICMKTTIVGITKQVLDHDHVTGKVRGYLCESCNTGIGRLDDNIKLIENALDWLKKD